jgi:hypothetical protein
MLFLLRYKKRLLRALSVFFLPALLLALLVYAIALWLGRELFSEPPIPDNNADYLTLLLAGAAIFTTLASVEAQIYFNLNERVHHLQQNREAIGPVVRAREFTWRGGWMFAHAVPPVLVLLAVKVSGWSPFGIRGCVAALQYSVLILFVVGWICLIAATLRKPLDRR